MLTPTVFFIDFEAFQHGSGDYIVKELCIIDVIKPQKHLYYVYLPPRSWESLSHDVKRTFDYETKSLHKLTWQEGYTRFCSECLRRDMETYLFATSSRKCSLFFTMGEQKAEFLQRLLPDCTVLNYQKAYDVASIKDLPPVPGHLRCPHRYHGDRCAYFKCVRMYLHYTTL